MIFHYGRGSLVVHKGRVGIVVSRHGKAAPWYMVEFHQPMPAPAGPMANKWLDEGNHKKQPEWHYEVSLKPLTSDWDGTVPASLLRRILGFQVMDIWLRGFCFGRSKGWEDGRRKERFKVRAKQSKL